MREELINSIEAVVTRFISSKSVEYFKGGSRRFGYNNNKSDVDFFVYIPHDKIKSFVEAAAKLGFIDNNKRDYESDYSLQLSNLIHISVYRNVNYFENLRNKHAMIYNYMQSHPEMIELAKGFKRCGYGGKWTFNVLEALVKAKTFES